ncbi:4a-hydroxytetrahydrobiopterin dehydratase [Rhodococcus spelaei]|uniref:Putative pterin-4-alpha-carbinolamine dehydratase n=1 Tax=Rhodococcus spelaei TaxID=2546320 RepID=A0A541BNI5_9NOCA|nr:4a-hydroxytetrahydrobiopterin dehydratase [Rhodococcus spelaei]TQF73854.1 4a-hydroxytetrahydrobiopterin dehydratase [Rhodococcus spelaei]
MAELLTDAEVDTALTGLPQWQRAGSEIVRTIELPTFPAAIALVDRVAEAAETRNHHPDIDIRWRTVTFTCSTHFKGGLTELDVALAQEIDRLAAG